MVVSQPGREVESAIRTNEVTLHHTQTSKPIVMHNQCLYRPTRMIINEHSNYTLLLHRMRPHMLANVTYNQGRQPPLAFPFRYSSIPSPFNGGTGHYPGKILEVKMCVGEF